MARSASRRAWASVQRTGSCSTGAVSRAVLGETLDTLRSLGEEVSHEALLGYAALAERTAVLDLDQLDPHADPVDQAESALLRTVLLEPALLALRRLAQEHESARRNT
ncbi:hypothetical protein AB0D10_32980 [Kitasatospora sp. NPDC048545]|uniref:hypothetical protein n=1 Tax=Kitasatospora sp. NPDC048545 TaxID=3157208 RepID=UPI003402C4D4